MSTKRAINYVIAVLSVSYLYSCVYFFLPLKKMGEICLAKAQVEGQEMCVLPLSMIFMIFYMFIPMIVAIVMQKMVYKEPLRDVGFSFKWTPWYFFAWLMPVAATYLAISAASFFPGCSVDLQMSAYIENAAKSLTADQVAAMKKQIEAMGTYTLLIVTFQGMIAGVTINAVAAFGEEAGWRGFLQKNMEGINFYKTAAIIGAVWGLWQLPVIIQGHNYPEHPVAGIFMMTAWCMLLTPLMMYAVKKTGSVLAAAIFHGTLNGTGGMMVLFVKGGNDLTTGAAGLASMIALLILNIGLYLYDRFYAADEEKVITKKAGAAS